MKVLFVCTGNTCRSPMAEVLFEAAAKEAGLSVEVQSAGFAAFPGVPITAETVQALAESGLDASGRTSRPLSKDLALSSDLILTMTRRHREAILGKMPSLEGKVHLLSEFAGWGEQDVEDPMGGGIEEYRKVRDKLSGLIRQAIERLRKEGGRF